MSYANASPIGRSHQQMKRGVVLGVLLALGGVSMLATSFQNPPAGQRRGVAHKPMVR
jgi:hypothetical protein